MRCIDADELFNQYPEDKQGEFSLIPLYEVRNSIKRAPTIDPVKHGRWIWESHKLWHICSVCKEEAIDDDCHGEYLSKYCPYCGARMDDEVTE